MRQASNNNILFYTSKKNGCDFYRIQQPGRKMVEHQIMPSAVARDMEPAELQIWVDKAGAIFSQNLENERFLDWMVDEQKNGRKMIVDYDDDPFNVSPFNPAYEKRGLAEVKFYQDDGSLLGEWKDGVDGFIMEENRKRLQTFCRALHQADMVTTTTSVLKDSFSRYSYRVKQIRNMVDLNVWKPLSLVKDEWTRIVYQGGWSHYSDFLEVKEALIEIFKAYPKVKLVVMGQWYPGILKGYEDRIEVHDWVDIELYPWVFKTLNADIGICPLENTKFNAAKSEIKWVEYSALKIPTIASAVRPYQVAIDEGKTGFLSRNAKDWVENLSKLIEGKELREDMGEEARKRIKDIYDVDKHMGIYKNAFLGCFGRELVIA